MKISGPASTIRSARRLRRELTLPEVMLWERLRKSDIRFRRQHPAGPYVLDFFCVSAKLVVEIDGIAHSMGDNPTYDSTRDAWLTAQGLRVLRVLAADILADAARVADNLIATARTAPLHHRKSDGPPPPVGEEHQEHPWNT